MKKVMSTILLCLLTSCLSMTLAPLEKRTASIVVDFPNIKKQQIYERSLQWMAHTFVSSKSVLEYQNIIEGKIIGNAVIPCHYISADNLDWGMMSVTHKLQLDIKDNKARVSFICLSMTLDNDKYHREYPMAEEYLPSVRKELNKLVKEYKKFVLSNISNDSNW